MNASSEKIGIIERVLGTMIEHVVNSWQWAWEFIRFSDNGLLAIPRFLLAVLVLWISTGLFVALFVVALIFDAIRNFFHLVTGNYFA